MSVATGIPPQYLMDDSAMLATILQLLNDRAKK